MTPLKATRPQVFCGKTDILQDVGLTVAAEAAIQAAAYPGDAA
jgi:hypothetical protein